jgi:hypothetical protein
VGVNRVRVQHEARALHPGAALFGHEHARDALHAADRQHRALEVCVRLEIEAAEEDGAFLRDAPQDEVRVGRERGPKMLPTRASVASMTQRGVGVGAS